jgi:hypothetical protein
MPGTMTATEPTTPAPASTRPEESVNPPEVLSGPQALAVRAILEGASITAAARQADVTRQTVSRWRREDPGFRAVLAAGWRELRFLTYQRLIGLAELALDSLRDVMLDAPDSRSRVRAAELILQHVGDSLKPTSREALDYYLDDEPCSDADTLWRYEANSISPHWVKRPEPPKD